MLIYQEKWIKFSLYIYYFKFMTHYYILISSYIDVENIFMI